MDIRNLKSQKGAVLVETVIVFSLLIALFLALFDFFTLSSAYVNLSQVAREGIMAGDGLSFFKGGSAASTCTGIANVDLQKDPQNQSYRNCKQSGGLDLAATCGHYLMQWRLQKALEVVRSNRMDPQSLSVTTICRPGSGTTKELEVIISGIYSGVSPFFKNSPMTVRQMGLVR